MLTGPDLLRVIADQIEAHPEKYTQDTWGSFGNEEVALPFLKVAERMAINDCGTQGCIAGWAAAFNVMDPVIRKWLSDDNNNMTYLGAELLCISESEASSLFDLTWKPAQGLTVSDALRRIADGASVDEVSFGECF